MPGHGCLIPPHRVEAERYLRPDSTKTISVEAFKACCRIAVDVTRANSAIEDAVAKERERCAEIAESYQHLAIAAAIRAVG